MGSTPCYTIEIKFQLDVFLLGSHLASIIFISRVFIEILGESFKIQFLAIFYIDFKKGFNQIWIRVVYSYY